MVQAAASAARRRERTACGRSPWALLRRCAARSNQCCIEQSSTSACWLQGLRCMGAFVGRQGAKADRASLLLLCPRHMIRTRAALQLLLPTCTQPAAMRTTRSAAAKAAAGPTNKPTEGAEHLAATKGGPKARKSRQGAAASTAAAAAAADAEDASQQAEGAPRAKRQRKAAVTVPELAGPPCFPDGQSLVRVGTSGEEGEEACGEPDCWACWSQGCFGRILLSSSSPPDAAGWQYKHWRGPDGFYGGEVWATCMRTLALQV